jgi:hypothetical protein
MIYAGFGSVKTRQVLKMGASETRGHRAALDCTDQRFPPASEADNGRIDHRKVHPGARPAIHVLMTQAAGKRNERRAIAGCTAQATGEKHVTGDRVQQWGRA